MRAITPKPVIHPTAVVAAGAELRPGVTIGAYAIVGEPKEQGPLIGARSSVGHHSIIRNDVSIGEACMLDPFSRVGPRSWIGDATRLLYGARVHEETRIGSRCVIAGNCPDRTTIGDDVVHLGRISHSYYFPFAEWDEPEEQGPTIESRVVICTDALLIGPIRIGTNSIILPGEIVRQSLPPNTFYRGGVARSVPRWPEYLRALGRAGWQPKGSTPK